MSGGRDKRFKGQEADYWLEAHGVADEPAGWRSYTDHLLRLTEDEAEQERLGFKTMCQGWLIGSEGWKQATAKAHAGMKLTAGVERGQARQLKEARWEQRLAQVLVEQGRGPVGNGPKKQGWKLEIALRLRNEEGASAAWLAHALQLGTPGTARSYMSRHRRSK